MTDNPRTDTAERVVSPLTSAGTTMLIWLGALLHPRVTQEMTDRAVEYIRRIEAQAIERDRYSVIDDRLTLAAARSGDGVAAKVYERLVSAGDWLNHGDIDAADHDIIAALDLLHPGFSGGSPTLNTSDTGAPDPEADDAPCGCGAIGVPAHTNAGHYANLSSDTGARTGGGLREAAIEYLRLDDALPESKPDDMPTVLWDAKCAVWKQARERLDAALSATQGSSNLEDEKP